MALHIGTLFLELESHLVFRIYFAGLFIIYLKSIEGEAVSSKDHMEEEISLFVCCSFPFSILRWHFRAVASESSEMIGLRVLVAEGTLKVLKVSEKVKRTGENRGKHLGCMSFNSKLETATSRT